MRISTAWSYQSTVSNMTNQQANVNQMQMEISTGQKYLTPSQNPVAASSMVDFGANIGETQQYQTNIGAAQEKLQLEESGLTSATNILQSARELTVQGLNGSQNAANRQQIAAQIDQLNQQLQNVANTQDADGQYIFSGTLTNTQPYTVDNSTTPPTYTYQGNANQQSILIGPANRQVTNGDPGPSVFGAIAAPLPLTAGSIGNIFQALSQLSSDLKNNTPSSGSLADIDTALNNIDTAQAASGAKLNALTSQQNINAQNILANQTAQSAVGDLNFASAVSQMEMQQTALQASESAFTKVQNLSLFQYM